MTLSQALADLRGDHLVRSVPGETDRIVVVQHGDEWRVGFRLTRRRSGPWEMVEFSALYTGEGSTTAEDLRRLPLGALLRHARRLVSNPVDQVPHEMVGRLRIVDVDSARLAAFLVDGRGRRKRTDEDFARLAWEYVLLVNEGDPSPAKTLSDRHGGSSAVWANRISEARRRGLLTAPEPGEAGGQLTDRGEELMGYPFGHPDDR
jgi:hypothetical protein